MHVRDNLAWLWKRLHGATDGEAIHLAAGCDVAPTDPDAPRALSAMRSRSRRAAALDPQLG